MLRIAAKKAAAKTAKRRDDDIDHAADYSAIAIQRLMGHGGEETSHHMTSSSGGAEQAGPSSSKKKKTSESGGSGLIRRLLDFHESVGTVKTGDDDDGISYVTDEQHNEIDETGVDDHVEDEQLDYENDGPGDDHGIDHVKDEQSDNENDETGDDHGSDHVKDEQLDNENDETGDDHGFTDVKDEQLDYKYDETGDDHGFTDVKDEQLDETGDDHGINVKDEQPSELDETGDDGINVKDEQLSENDETGVKDEQFSDDDDGLFPASQTTGILGNYEDGPLAEQYNSAEDVSPPHVRHDPQNKPITNPTDATKKLILGFWAEPGPDNTYVAITSEDVFSVLKRRLTDRGTIFGAVYHQWVLYVRMGTEAQANRVYKSNCGNVFYNGLLTLQCELFTEHDMIKYGSLVRDELRAKRRPLLVRKTVENQQWVGFGASASSSSWQ